MIAVDTSALIAILLREPDGRACTEVLKTERDLLISAVTLFEALIVAGRRGIISQMNRIIDFAEPEVIVVTAETARRAAAVYEVWGKGIHPAGLNFGDCFAYDVAKHHGCKLLFVGNDFAQTDIEPALAVNR